MGLIEPPMQGSGANLAAAKTDSTPKRKARNLRAAGRDLKCALVARDHTFDADHGSDHNKQTDHDPQHRYGFFLGEFSLLRHVDKCSVLKKRRPAREASVEKIISACSRPDQSGKHRKVIVPGCVYSLLASLQSRVSILRDCLIPRWD